MEHVWLGLSLVGLLIHQLHSQIDTVYTGGEIVGSSDLLLEDSDVEVVVVNTALGNQSQDRKVKY